MINYSVMIQLAEPNHGSWTVDDSVSEAFFPKKIQGVTQEEVDKKDIRCDYARVAVSSEK
jgi:hypothetical protein